jgi:electron transfer flavoprotein alpha/beta subunit
MREALAKGADRAIHIVCDDLGSRDALWAWPACWPTPSARSRPTWS